MGKRHLTGIGPLLLTLSVAQPSAWGKELQSSQDSAPSTQSPADQSGLTAPVREIGTIPIAAGEASAEVPQDAGKRVANRVIEEVVITAQKREERLQDVPISIQAFSGEAMAARGIETTSQLGQSVPSLQFTEVLGYSLIFMRGIGTDNFIPSADPSIATYIDGIYVPQGHSTLQSLGNVHRVEVLKGPQGTLFGRNSTGGAISVVTEEPDNFFKGSAEGEIGRFNDRSAKASVSGPVTDWLSASLSGLISRKDSIYSDINYKTEPDFLRAVRLKVNIHPTDTLSLSLTGYHSAQQGLGSLIGKNTDPSLLGKAVGIEAQTDDYTAVSDLHAGSKASQDLYYGNLTWNSPWFDVKFLGSDQYILTHLSASDFEGSPLPIAAFDTTHEYTKLQTGELQVVSNANTWGAERFKWVAGLYYLHSNAGFDPGHLRAAPQALASGAALLGLQLPAGLQNLLATIPVGNTPLEDQGIAVSIEGLLGTKSYSAYTQGTYSFTDWLDLTLGGRFQRERRYLTKAQTGVVDPLSNDGNDVFQVIHFPLQGATASNFSPKAVLGVHPRENALIYASYSVGFKSGTYNIANIYTPPNYIVPEQVTSYEVGAKIDFFDGLLRLNGAVFDNEIKNLQSGFVAILSGGAVRFQTAAAARTRGAEIDGTLIPFPSLNPGLALTGNAAYVDAIYTDFQNGSGFQKGTGIYSGNLDFSGDRIVRTPKVSGGVGAVQTLEGSQGTYELAVDEYYNSGFYYDAYNTVKENPYSILNARVGYLHTPWNLRATLFGKNLLDRRYHIQQYQSDFGVVKTLAPPREYGIRLNWEF